MKTKRNAKNSSAKKILAIVLVSLLVAIGAVFTYVYAFNGSILGWSASPQKDEAKDESKQTDTTNTPSTTETPSPEPSKGTEPSTEVPENITVIFSATNQTETTLQIRALIEAVLGSGQCTLTLTKGSVSLTKIAAVQSLASSSTCAGFDVPLSELSSGEWRLNLSVSSGSSKGSVQKDLTVR